MDLEMTPPAHMHREKAIIPEAQQGSISFLSRPLTEAVVEAMPKLKHALPITFCDVSQAKTTTTTKTWHCVSAVSC